MNDHIFKTYIKKLLCTIIVTNLLNIRIKLIFTKKSLFNRILTSNNTLCSEFQYAPIMPSDTFPPGLPSVHPFAEFCVFIYDEDGLGIRYHVLAWCKKVVCCEYYFSASLEGMKEIVILTLFLNFLCKNKTLSGSGLELYIFKFT